MEFSAPLIQGRLLKRYKRFLADIELASGELITAHTSNTGAMTGLTQTGSPVYVSQHDHPKRKLKYTWQLIQIDQHWVGINPILANHLTEEAIRNDVITELQGYDEIKREVRYGNNSRIDLLLSKSSGENCYVEVKNATLVEQQTALFPDAVTLRGLKHLQELSQMTQAGHRAVMCYIVQRSDINRFAPADHIDPTYGKALRLAQAAGVELIAYNAQVSPQGIRLKQALPISLP